MTDRHCKNCGNKLYEGHVFCFKCGARYTDVRLTPKAILNEVSERYLGIDNKFLRTMVAMIKDPDQVIDGYISGTRRRFINPINFYILGLTLIGFLIFIYRKWVPENFGFGQQGMSELDATVFDTVMDYLGLLSTINLPIYALAGYLAFLNCKKYNFTEHLIFTIYIWGFYNIVTSVFALLGVLLDIDYFIVSSLFTPFAFLHTFYAYAKIYKIGWSRVAIKSIFYILLWTMISVVVFVALAVLGVYLVTEFYPEVLEQIKSNSNGTSL